MSSQVSEIESKIDIVELVSKYIKIKKAGANYKSVCPFPGHNEKTPSFVVSPSKQLAYCFGCHKWGWPLKFIMDIENYEFREALEVLWNQAGVSVKKYDEKTEKLIKNSYSIFKDAWNYYTQALQKYPKILKYCTERNMTTDDISQFKIWFADSGMDHLEYLKGKGYDDKMIADSQIFLDIRAKKDKFLNRLIFPIQNLRGDVVAFAGRVLDKSLPKYLNSPASKIYDKSSILYWLFQARNEINKKNFVIVVEGYMDVIALHRHWYKNTVCVSGTALTEKHITILKRITKKIYLCFDSDNAWKNATQQSIELLKNKGLEIKIISIESGKDADEALASGDDFNEYIKNAMSPIGFYIQKIKQNYDLTSLEEKKKFLLLLLEAIKYYSDNVERDFYLKEISRELDIERDMVYLEFSKIRRKKEVIEQVHIEKEYSASEFAIWHMLVDRSYRQKIQEGLIFGEDYDDAFMKILSDEKSLDNLDIDLRDRYKAISLKIDDMNLEKTDDTIHRELDKLIKKLNSEVYKKKRDTYLQEEKHEEYVALLKVAKEHNLK